jgi:hypothetical protein
MANKIIQGTRTAAGAPSAGSVEVGQIVLNWADNKMYIKKQDGTFAIFNIH